MVPVAIPTGGQRYRIFANPGPEFAKVIDTLAARSGAIGAGTGNVGAYRRASAYGSYIYPPAC